MRCRGQIVLLIGSGLMAGCLPPSGNLRETADGPGEPVASAPAHPVVQDESTRRLLLAIPMV